MPLHANAREWLPPSKQAAAPSSQPICISRVASKSTFQNLSQQHPVPETENVVGKAAEILDTLAVLHDEGEDHDSFDARALQASVRIQSWAGLNPFSLKATWAAQLQVGGTPATRDSICRAISGGSDESPLSPETPRKLQKEQQEFEAEGDGPVLATATIAENVRMGPHDFEMLRVVGQGAFG